MLIDAQLLLLLLIDAPVTTAADVDGADDDADNDIDSETGDGVFFVSPSIDTTFLCGCKCMMLILMMVPTMVLRVMTIIILRDSFQ